MKKLLLSSLAVLGLLTPLLRAEALDPASDKWHLTSVSWIQAHENDLDRDDTAVAVVGKVTEKHSSHVYFFQDGTGTIELDSDIDLPVGKAIVVRGRIDQAFLHIGPLQINVDSWRPVGRYGVVLTK